MACINLRNGRYRVSIRRKEQKLNATFSHKETAETWARYKEELLDNMHSFDIPIENMITLRQCVDIKIAQIKSKPSVDPKTINDFENIYKEFDTLMEMSLSEITPNIIRDISKQKLNSIVSVGGSHKEGSGSIRICSSSTVLRKLRLLASVFSHMIENGANIINPAQVVINQVKMSIIKKSGISENDE